MPGANREAASSLYTHAHAITMAMTCRREKHALAWNVGSSHGVWRHQNMSLCSCSGERKRGTWRNDNDPTTTTKAEGLIAATVYTAPRKGMQPRVP